MLVIFLIAMLLVTALIPCNAEEKVSTVKWTQKEDNLYETTTFYFTVLTRMEDQNYLYLLDKLIGQLDQTAKQTSDFIGSEFRGSFGLIINFDPDAGSFKWNQYRSYFKNDALVGYIDWGYDEILKTFTADQIAEIAGPFAVQMMFKVSSKATLPFWMNKGLAQWCCDNLVKEKMTWADYRSKNGVSFRIKNKAIDRIYPLAAPQTWSASSFTLAKAVSIFYFLEHKFGAEAIATFMKTWLAEPNLDSALQQAFGSSQKELESDWRRFVLFEGVSQYQWLETASTYQVAVSGAELNIKKDSAIWYDEKLDEQVRQIVAANALIESCQATFKKTPFLKFELYKKASKNSVKKGSSGFYLAVADQGAEDIAADFLKVATEKAVATLKLKSLPKSAVEGFQLFIAVQSGCSSEARDADFFAPTAATDDYDQHDVYNAMVFLQETYGSSKIVPLMSELNKGISLRAAVIAVADDSEEQIDAALDFLRYLPSPSTLEWVRIPGGFRTELGNLRVDVENQALGVRIKSDLEKTFANAAKIAQKMPELTGWQPGIADGRVTVHFGAGEQSVLDNIFIPISTDNFDYAAEDLDARIVDYWLTMATEGASAPSWLVYGLGAVLDESNPATINDRIKYLETQLDDWIAPFGTKRPSRDQKDLWFTVVQYLLAQSEGQGKLRQWLAAAAEDGFEAGLEKTYGFDYDGLFANWLSHMQAN